jgi:receptor protein-tyrosine kinase
MLHIRLPSVINDLRKRPALVLVDTPPVLPVSDARLVAPLADGVILVATAGTQKPASFQAAIDRLALVDSRLLGVVLNKAGQDDVDIGAYYRYEATGETAERLGTGPPARVPSAAPPQPAAPPPAAERAAGSTRTTAPPVEQV